MLDLIEHQSLHGRGALLIPVIVHLALLAGSPHQFLEIVEQFNLVGHAKIDQPELPLEFLRQVQPGVGQKDKAVLTSQIAVQIAERPDQDRIVREKRWQIPQQVKALLTGIPQAAHHLKGISQTEVTLQPLGRAPGSHWPIVAIMRPGQCRQLPFQALLLATLQVDDRILVGQTLGQPLVEVVVHIQRSIEGGWPALTPGIGPL